MSFKMKNYMPEEYDFDINRTIELEIDEMLEKIIKFGKSKRIIIQHRYEILSVMELLTYPTGIKRTILQYVEKGGEK
ncbi:MAG: hypothetical protein DDT42_02097 [candidate division WS2 bacterium]|uniref:Uncharacterized protein n=1 Tax=Psychracetigena formicireducens TaxID=2986056 RepID=A0A9E2BKH7_PSYF1|nr:hypothetical protein [Candidatus Psychracetigena formicireducens]